MSDQGAPSRIYPVARGRQEGAPSLRGFHTFLSIRRDAETRPTLCPTVGCWDFLDDVASTVTGPLACEPAIFDPTDPDFILPTMFLGIWTQGANGTGSLTATNTNGGADYVPLSKIGTVSIRNTTINGGFGPEAVMACGEVVSRPSE